MRRLALSLAALFLLRADMYPDAGNAVKPQAQHNLGQMKSIVPQNYGAVGDGVADDTAAVQAWIDALKTGLYYGQCDGIFRLTASINAFPTKSYTIQGSGAFITGQPGGCQFLVDYNDWTSAAIDITNPSSPTNTNRGFPAWWKDFSIVYNPALTAPPIGFKARYNSGLQMHNATIMQYTVNWGTCLSISSAWNTRLRDVRNVGCGGNISARVMPAGLTFTMASGTSTLTSSAPFFDAADVGTDMVLLSTGSPRELFRISAYTNPTTVTVNRNSSFNHTGTQGAMGAITGSMTSGSPTLTLSHPNMTSNDIGRTVYVLGAGTTTGTAVGALKSTITAVSGSTVTLANNAGTTAPAGSPVIISPAMEVYSENTGAAITNDIRIDGLHSEFFGGTGLVITDGVNVRATTWKLHGMNNTTTIGQSNKETQFQAVLVNTDTQLGQGEIEGTAITTDGSIMIQGVTTGGNAIGTLGGGGLTGQSRVALAKNLANTGVSVGHINGAGQIANGWIPSMVKTDTTGIGFVALGPITTQLSTVQLPKLIGTLPTSTVALLPACSTSTEGRMYAVSDANSAVFNAAVAAGGANKVIAYCDGAGWKVH